MFNVGDLVRVNQANPGAYGEWWNDAIASVIDVNYLGDINIMRLSHISGRHPNATYLVYKENWELITKKKKEKNGFAKFLEKHNL